MRLTVVGLGALVLLAGSAGAVKKSPPPIADWAACAAQKNADEISWAYMLNTGQTDLTGIALDGARATALFLMGRDCLPDRTGFDNKTAQAFTAQAVAAWKGDLTRHSLPRPIDGWADCLAAAEPGKARAYLFARDFATFGPKLVVQDIDPVEALFAPVPACDPQRPERATMVLHDLYARLTYRLRVAPRVKAAGA